MNAMRKLVNHKAHLMMTWVVCLTMLSACSEKDDQGFAAMGPMQMNVVAYRVELQDISDELTLVGTLKANESVEIRSESDGVIEAINFKEGDAVKQGDVLFKIDERKLKATFDQALANLNLAKATAERYEALIKTNAVSRQEYDQALASLETNQAGLNLTKEQLNDSTILASFDGVMGERLVSVGQFVTKGTPLSILIDQDPIKVEVPLPERHLNAVKVGQNINLRVSAYPEQVFEGKVIFVDPRVNENTRTVLLKAVIPNDNRLLKTGMFANLKLTINVKSNAVVIPETALVTQGDDTLVFTINKENKAVQKSVSTGIRHDGYVEIIKGVQSQEVVITEGQQKIRDGSFVKARYMEGDK